MKIKYFRHRRHEDEEDFWFQVDNFLADHKVTDIKFQSDKLLIELLIIYED